jgi:hypothetical protein
MKDAMILLFHLLAVIARLLRPGGGRTIVAENLLPKQLLLHCKSRSRAPNLSTLDQVSPGFWTLFLNPGRKTKVGIIGISIHPGDVDGPATRRMFNVAISKQNLPSYLSSDNDPLFLYHRWQTNLCILEIDEVKSVPYTPISHPFVVKTNRKHTPGVPGSNFILDSHRSGAEASRLSTVF